MYIKEANGKKKIVMSREEWEDIGRRGKWGPHAAGPGGCCVCPKCGKEVKHERGVPCKGAKCPECDVAMMRKEIAEEERQEEQDE